MITARNSLFGLSFQELSAIAEQLGQPSDRARQIYQAMYSQRRQSLAEVTNLPRDFKNALEEQGFSIDLPRIQKQFTSSDGTIRYLLELGDGQSVETVWMPEGDGGEAGDGSEAGAAEDSELSSAGGWKQRGRFHRATICISSQVGCAVDCHFCMTALLGLKRNLSAGEIAGQVVTVLNERGVTVEKERINLVFMGQGEPFLNYDNFMKAVRLLADPEGIGIPVSRMTVSTSGIVPRIYDFGKEEIRPKLAISLNASNDESRLQLMPITKKWG